MQLERVGRGALRAIGVALASFALFFAIVCVLIVVQGSRDEARMAGAGAAVVLQPPSDAGDPAAAQPALDHALDLYRQGLINRVILLGTAPGADRRDVSAAAAERDYLVRRGMPADVLLIEERGETAWESMRGAADLARSQGTATVLLVGDFPSMLRSLKMAGDLGLSAHPSPSRPASLSPELVRQAGPIGREAWAYLDYLFARR